MGNGVEPESLKLIGIEIVEGEQETYTISGLDGGDNFFANGFLVGVEKLKGE